MVFSSIPFLFFFLPFCLLLYYAVPFSWKNKVLLVFSLIFYAWGEPVYILLMLFAAGVDYGNARLMTRYGTTTGRRRFFLCCSVVINLSVLAFFKYADFLIQTVNTLSGTSFSPLGLGLPVGISFYTFQTMSYSIDLYRKKVKAEKNYLTYLTYVSMFPQLVAGPIVRFATVNEELHSRKIKKEEVENGLFRFMQGLFKKVLLANRTGALWEEIRLLPAGSASAATAWLGAAAFTLQLYFDFSGYSDMAIGLGRMLGFRFLENFNYPFLADSITDFWRRWHISMGTWFRDYVYIPLGGNKGGLAKQLRNIAIVWLLTGFWHGASWNFVLWGVYFGVLLVAEKLFLLRCLKRLPAVLRHIYALVLVTISWTLFAFTEISKGAAWCKAMLSGVLFDSSSLYLLLTYGPMLAICALAATPLGKLFYKKLGTRLGQRALTVVDCGGLACVLVMAAAYLVSGSYNPFRYFRF